MTFSTLLNQYLDMLSLSGKEISERSGVSQATISRYRRGEIEPAVGGTALDSIVEALAAVAVERGIDLPAEEIITQAETSLTAYEKRYEEYLQKLRVLLSELNIRNAEFARGVSYDPSYISRILSGVNKPADLDKFTAQTATFIRRYVKANDIPYAVLCRLYGCTEEELRQPNGIFDITVAYLGYDETVQEVSDDPLLHFLDKMESFNLSDFIRSIRFDDIKLPTVPFQLPSTKTYLGIKEMMESELDFMKATVISRSKKDCILYSDMPMEEMAKDPEFPKKWMFGRAMMLKKGLNLHIIHNVNRPFHEMMLGLESYIPMYMTGQISPYYFPDMPSKVFSHILNVSGAAALEGHAITGHQEDGVYTLYKSKEDVKRLRKNAEQMLNKAQPLMDIYTGDRKEEFLSHLRKIWETGYLKVVPSSLPLYTIGEELLNEILERNQISEEDAEHIRRFRQEYREATERLLEENKLTLVAPELSKEQFEKMPLNLSLAELFFENDVPYTYEEYVRHLEETKEFAKSHERMELKLDNAPPFRNISYSVIADKIVIVSKNRFPTIHFVIHHKKMVQAFRYFIPPVRESAEV